MGGPCGTPRHGRGHGPGCRGCYPRGRAPLVDGVIQRAIVPLCNVIGFRITDFGGCCILRNAVVVSFFLRDDDKLGAILFGVVVFRGDDTPEIVRPVHGILFSFHEDGGEGFRHGGDVGVNWIFAKETIFLHASFRASVTSLGVLIYWCGRSKGG